MANSLIRDLLLSFLGFTGDIILDDGYTFRIRDGFSLERESERHQVNILVPLGWYYFQLNQFVDKYSARWGLKARSAQFETYKFAVAQGVDDLLHEYVDDISYLEQMVLTDGTVPLSYIFQHLQKYLLAFPSLYAVLREMEISSVTGTQLLDYFKTCESLCGTPVMIDIYQRILFKLRVVFIKQCFSWMAYGELEDPRKEFFITSAATDSTASPSLSLFHDRVVARVHNATLVDSQRSGALIGQSDLDFDWSSSYVIQLEKIPDSHISPRMASKIMFAGKAKKLLQLSADGFDDIFDDKLISSSDAYDYLSNGCGAAVLCGDGLAGKAMDQSKCEQRYVSGGYTDDDIERFSIKLKEALQRPEETIELFDQIVEDVSGTISNRLWQLLKTRLGFVTFLTIIRNTYLLGKGELFQTLLDGILALTISPIPDSSQEINDLINWKVVRASAKLVGLDDDSLGTMIKLRANSLNVVIRNFSTLSDGDICLAGAAQLGVSRRAVFSEEFYNTDATIGQSGVKEIHPRVSAAASTLQRTMVSLCDRHSLYASKSSAPFEKLWSDFVFAQPGVGDNSEGSSSLRDSSITSNDEGGSKYVSGSLWLADQKYVAKGFHSNVSFSISSLPSEVQGSKAGDAENCTGHFCFCICADRQQSGVRLSGAAGRTKIPFGSEVGRLDVCVSFFAMSRQNELRYYAKLFVSKNGYVESQLDSSTESSNILCERIILLKTAPLSTQKPVAEREMGLFPVTTRQVSSYGVMQLEVEYMRVNEQSSVSTKGSVSSVATLSNFVYRLRARLLNAADQLTSPDSLDWDIDIPVDIALYVKCQGGHAFIGWTGSGVATPGNNEPIMHQQQHSLSEANLQELNQTRSQIIERPYRFGFSIDVYAIEFRGRATMVTYPAVSPFTSTRFPDTAAKLESAVSKFRAWMNIKLELRFPPILKIVFDHEAVGQYERVFCMIMKIRLIAHSLERLWIVRSGLSEDRNICHVRHSMHFFISNLLYYLQVDVVDAEFVNLQQISTEAVDFQLVLRAHKTFLANILRLSMIDNSSIQDSMDKIVHICIRFIALYRLMSENENMDSVPAAVVPPLYVPPEELSIIRKEFYAQVGYLFYLMRNLDCKGFMFRLDFNNFMSRAENNPV